MCVWDFVRVACFGRWATLILFALQILMTDNSRRVLPCTPRKRKVFSARSAFEIVARNQMFYFVPHRIFPSIIRHAGTLIILHPKTIVRVAMRARNAHSQINNLIEILLAFFAKTLIQCTDAHSHNLSTLSPGFLSAKI